MRDKENTSIEWGSMTGEKAAIKGSDIKQAITVSNWSSISLGNWKTNRIHTEDIVCGGKGDGVKVIV